MSQTSDLKEAVSQLGVDLGEAISRVEAKIVELGLPDPDLSADIAAIKNVSAALDGLVAAPAPAPAPEPAPVEPPAA